MGATNSWLTRARWAQLQSSRTRARWAQLTAGELVDDERDKGKKGNSFLLDKIVQNKDRVRFYSKQASGN